ncbi:MAG: DUF4329 domain-containing protein [Robiginitomaculum sp.]|nr:DUF4329 domain-containing protein [Robiginitomaculum sp.]
MLDNMNNSCGTGNPCPEAPPDTDEELTEEQKCQLEQAKEAAIDSLARQIAKDIMKKRDWKNREYGAVIIRNSAGELRVTELFRGTSLGGSVNLEFSISSSDTIVASIHNHTLDNYNNATGQVIVTGRPQKVG